MKNNFKKAVLENKSLENRFPHTFEKNGRYQVPCTRGGSLQIHKRLLKERRNARGKQILFDVGKSGIFFYRCFQTYIRHSGSELALFQYMRLLKR